jgi:hypothetical protein
MRSIKTYVGASEQCNYHRMDVFGNCRWHNKNDVTHREDGPAVICPDGVVYWCYNGKYTSFEEWCIKTNISDEQQMLLRLQYA